MDIGARLSIWRNGFSVDGGSWIRQTGPGYIQTDIAWDSDDMVIEVDIQNPVDTSFGNAYTVIASVSDTQFSLSDIDNGYKHGWLLMICSQSPQGAIALVTGYGLGAVYRFYYPLSSGSVQWSNNEPPIFNRLSYTP